MNDISAKRLSDLQTSEVGVITKVYGHGSFRKRITEMGFVRGKSVKVVKNAPLMDPVEYEIMGYHIALRRNEAQLIEVAPFVVEGEKARKGKAADATMEYQSTNRFLHEAGGTVINVALVGNPNSGKTSLFNIASNSHERVGNYSGVTVDAKSAQFRHKGHKIRIVDLPGTYSITEYTPEELYVRKYILDEMPDVVINVIDASNIERNLYLTTQLIDMDLKVVVALNMYDELTESGAQLDYEALGRLLGIPFVPTVAARNKGIKELLDTVLNVFEDNEPVSRHIHINYGDDIETSIDKLQDMIWQNADIVARYSSRYIALKLIEGDKETLSLLGRAPNFEEIRQAAAHENARLEKLLGERTETAIADAKYGFIAGALAETYEAPSKTKNDKASRIDRVMTHKWFGFPMFFLMMWLMFEVTFTVGQYPMDWIESGVALLGEWVRGAMEPGSLRDLLTDGIIGGVGGVMVFLPNIMLLFFFISILEDTGYMARAAFIMDRVMHRIGLHGKSFIPLLMGFGCNVPAIMATRTLESRKDRMLTMLIIPFMSCSARMPVYVLLISAFFVKQQGLILLSIYTVGIVVAILSSLLFRRLFFRDTEAPFVMELPPYRMPTGRSVVKHMWNKASQYLRKMGGVILVASVIIWTLSYFPRNVEYSVDYDAMRTEAADSVAIKRIDLEQASEKQARSYIGRLGHFVEPAIAPLGFNWQVGVSLVTGVAAKEIIVSSMAVLYGANDENESLAERLREQKHISGPRAGEPVFTPLVAYNMMIFILLYFPCFAVFAAIRKEAGLKWAVFSAFYTTGIAWLIALLVYQIGTLF